ENKKSTANTEGAWISVGTRSTEGADIPCRADIRVSSGSYVAPRGVTTAELPEAACETLTRENVCPRRRPRRIRPRSRTAPTGIRQCRNNAGIPLSDCSHANDVHRPRPRKHCGNQRAPPSRQDTCPRSG